MDEIRTNFGVVVGDSSPKKHGVRNVVLASDGFVLNGVVVNNFALLFFEVCESFGECGEGTTGTVEGGTEGTIARAEG